jgi:hypothetical protein
MVASCQTNKERLPDYCDCVESLVSTVYEVLSESSWTWSEKRSWLNLLNFHCHLLQNSFLENVYSDTITFSTLQKHLGSNFPYCCQVLLMTPCEHQSLLPYVIPLLPFSICETKRNHRGVSPTSREVEE